MKHSHEARPVPPLKAWMGVFSAVWISTLLGLSSCAHLELPGRGSGIGSGATADSTLGSDRKPATQVPILSPPSVPAETLIAVPQQLPQSFQPSSTRMMIPLTENLRRPVRIGISVEETARIDCYSMGRLQVLWELNGERTIGGEVRGEFRIERRDTRIALIPKGSQAQTFPAAARLLLHPINPYNFIEVAGTLYRGAFEFSPGAGGKLIAVNALDLEDYLRGVLPLEMGFRDPISLEALKAQAVAARTYSLKRMQRPNNARFDMWSDVRDQVYKGSKPEYWLADRAVAETRALVLTHADTLTNCFYHSTCGGLTAAIHEVWGGGNVPYLISRSDKAADGVAYCAPSRMSSWSDTWDANSLTASIKRNLVASRAKGPSDFSSIRSIQVRSRTSCGRVSDLAVQTDRGEILVRGDKTRWAMRRPNNATAILPSAWFDITSSGASYIIQGKAFGHGIGLCQMGALGRAKAGQDFEAILVAYYAGTRLAEIR